MQLYYGLRADEDDVTETKPAYGAPPPQRMPRVTDAEAVSVLRNWAQSLANERTLQDRTALLSDEVAARLALREQLRQDRQAAEWAVHVLVERLASEIAAEAGR